MIAKSKDAANTLLLHEKEANRYNCAAMFAGSSC